MTEPTNLSDLIAQLELSLGRKVLDEAATLKAIAVLKGAVFGEPVLARPIVAWEHEEDPERVIADSQKQTAMRDGGASASSVRPYSIALGRLAIGRACP